MNKKVLVIIKSDKNNFLLLRTNPKWMKEDIWFIVTGSLKKGESYKKAVKREIKEETGLKILKIRDINCSCRYEWPKKSGKMHYEKYFFAIVEEKEPKLSGEHLEYKWLNKTKFLKSINWEGDKKQLREILE